jgi:hypothetical protein
MVASLRNCSVLRGAQAYKMRDTAAFLASGQQVDAGLMAELGIALASWTNVCRIDPVT